jgi:gp94
MKKSSVRQEYEYVPEEEFDFEPQDGCVYVVVKAISARINQNYDAWPSEELRDNYETFIGDPVFVNHKNEDPERTRGIVLDAKYVEDEVLEDKYILLLIEVDGEAFPNLAHEIVTGGIDSVSMGADIEYSTCSICGNEAVTQEDLCMHVERYKGCYLQDDGEEKLVYEICHGVEFFEISFVFDPADETALFEKVKDARTSSLPSESFEVGEVEDPEESVLIAVSPVLEDEEEEKPLTPSSKEMNHTLTPRKESVTVARKKKSRKSAIRANRRLANETPQMKATEELEDKEDDVEDEDVEEVVQTKEAALLPAHIEVEPVEGFEEVAHSVLDKYAPNGDLVVSPEGVIEFTTDDAVVNLQDVANELAEAGLTVTLFDVTTEDGVVAKVDDYGINVPSPKEARLSGRVRMAKTRRKARLRRRASEEDDNLLDNESIKAIDPEVEEDIETNPETLDETTEALAMKTARLEAKAGILNAQDVYKRAAKLEKLPLRKTAAFHAVAFRLCRKQKNASQARPAGRVTNTTPRRVAAREVPRLNPTRTSAKRGVDSDALILL